MYFSWKKLPSLWLGAKLISIQSNIIFTQTLISINWKHKIVIILAKHKIIIGSFKTLVVIVSISF